MKANVILAADRFGRYATKVRIESPVGSRYNGQVGRVHHVVGDTVIVRFESGLRLAFGASELKEIS